MIEDFEIEIGGTKKIVKFRSPERRDLRNYRAILKGIQLDMAKEEYQTDVGKADLNEITENKILDILVSLNSCGIFKSHADFETVTIVDISKLIGWMNSKVQINFNEGFLQK